MRRLALAVAVLSLSGCVVTAGTVVPVPPPVAPGPVEVWYGGQHAVPPALGGGWCWVDGPHVHDYFPDPICSYAFADGFYYWRGPVLFTYYGGHPLPGGGWCYIAGPHVHNYYPPRDTYWVFTPGRGYLYRGPYSAARPAPAHYWVRPAPPRVYRAPATPAPVYRSPAPAPAPRAGRPAGRGS